MNLCQEMSGFLFKHRCGRFAHMVCGLCAKPLCMQHARPRPPEGFACVTCAALAPATRPPHDNDDDTGGGDWDDDDPHFYSRDYHQRSGGEAPDGMDFTDGDRISTSGAGSDWEEDAGGS